MRLIETIVHRMMPFLKKTVNLVFVFLSKVQKKKTIVLKF
jgi:hypothetical protein